MLKSHQFLDQLSSEWYSHAGKIDNVGLLTSKTISFPRSIIGGTVENDYFIIFVNYLTNLLFRKNDIFNQKMQNCKMSKSAFK